MNEEKTLKHHGIFGQKWGVRRYQNRDGTLTDAGKKRYGDTYGPYSDLSKQMRNDAAKADKEDIKRMTEESLKPGKDGKPSKAEKILSKTKGISEDMQHIMDTTKPKKTTSSLAKSMTDQELRDAINRMELERRFDSLNTSDVKSGREKVNDFLSITGDIVSIGLGIGGILSAYYAISQARVKE